MKKLLLIVILFYSCGSLTNVNNPYKKQVVWKKEIKDSKYYINNIIVNGNQYKSAKIGDKIKLIK